VSDLLSFVVIGRTVVLLPARASSMTLRKMAIWTIADRGKVRCIYIYIYIYVYICVFLCVCVSVYVYIMRVCVLWYVRLCMYMYIMSVVCK
jgi:hypothetical protein